MIAVRWLKEAMHQGHLKILLYLFVAPTAAWSYH